jgi:hypothetical protein
MTGKPSYSRSTITTTVRETTFSWSMLSNVAIMKDFLTYTSFQKMDLLSYSCVVVSHCERYFLAVNVKIGGSARN